MTIFPKTQNRMLRKKQIKIVLFLLYKKNLLNVPKFYNYTLKNNNRRGQKYSTVYSLWKSLVKKSIIIFTWRLNTNSPKSLDITSSGNSKNMFIYKYFNTRLFDSWLIKKLNVQFFLFIHYEYEYINENTQCI